MQDLRARGWVEGANFQVLERFTDDRPSAQMPGLVAELVAAKVEVIVVFDEGTAAAVRRLTNTTPIVFTHAAAPVELGLVSSLSRPGGNVTGVVSLGGDFSWQEDRAGAFAAARSQARRRGLVPRRTDLRPRFEAAAGSGHAAGSRGGVASYAARWVRSLGCGIGRRSALRRPNVRTSSCTVRDPAPGQTPRETGPSKTESLSSVLWSTGL